MTTFLSPCVLDAMPANKTLYFIKQYVCMWSCEKWIECERIEIYNTFSDSEFTDGLKGSFCQVVAVAYLYLNFVKSWSFWWVPVGQCGSYGCPRRLGLVPQRPSQRNAGKLSFYFATLASRVLILVLSENFVIIHKNGRGQSEKREKISKQRQR